MIEKMRNGLNLTHVATGYPQTIELTNYEGYLARDDSSMMNECWDEMCESVYKRLGIWIEGNYHVDEIIHDGVTMKFH